jgi:hypothetical protein
MNDQQAFDRMLEKYKEAAFWCAYFGQKAASPDCDLFDREMAANYQQKCVGFEEVLVFFRKTLTVPMASREVSHVIH